MKMRRKVKVIRAGTIITGKGDPPIQDAAIVVEDDRIKSVGPVDRLSASEKIVEFDATDKTVLPGLIDAHVHLTLGFLDDCSWQKLKDDPESLCLYAAGNAQKALVKGVTTLFDCGGVDLITLKLREAIKTGIIAGPRLRVSGAPITTTSGHLYFVGLRADNADEIRKSVRWLVENGVDFIKIMATGGYMTPISNRRRAQYDEYELKIVVEEAHRLRRRVIVHVNGTEGIRNSVKAGVDVLVHCNWFGIEDGTIEFDESIARLAAEKKIYADLGPISEFMKDDTRWNLGCRMRRLGVNIYLSSDGIGKEACRFPRDLRLFMENFDVDPIEVIKMSTLVPAKAMGIDKDLGSIEPNKIADLIVLGGNPLEDPRALERIRTVFLAGEIVAFEGKLCIREESETSFFS